MKVYVDELPKSCDDCPCFYDENISCQASDEWLPLDEEDNFSRSKQRHPTCPLKSLADYTKQVRKEVCDNFRKTARQYYEECDSRSLRLSMTDVWEILDQIQGDKK